MSIAQFCIEKKILTYVLSAALLLGGTWAYTQIGRLEDPEFTIKNAQVVTSYPGATAQEVMEEVTDPIEVAIQQLGQVKKVTSVSYPGRSIVMVEMKDQYGKNDLPQIWDELRRKVGDMQASLPPGCDAPKVVDDYGDVFGVFYGVYGDGYSYADLKAYAKILRRELLLCQDVAKIEMLGDQPEVVYLEISRARLATTGISPKQIQDAMLAGRNASIGFNLVTLGMGGWIADAVTEGISKELLEELTELSMQRAALDRSTERATVAMSMTDALIGLLERGGPYSASEQALLDTVGNMVRNSAVEVADNAAGMFREWKARQDAERAARGVNLLTMYDIGTPAPDFTLRAMARAGLGPGGDGFNGALVASLAGSSAAIGGRVVDASSLGARLSQRIYPFSGRTPPADTPLDDLVDEAGNARSKWVARQPTGRAGAVSQWVSANPSKAATNIRPTWKAGQTPNWRQVAQLRNVKGASAAPGIVDDLAKAGASTIDDVARKAGGSVAKTLARNIGKVAGNVGAKALKTVFAAAGKVAGPIGTAIAVVVDVGMGAGEIAEVYDNGQARLDEAAQKARTAPITNQTLSDMVSTQDGRLQLISILTGQLKRNPGAGLNSSGGAFAGNFLLP